MAAYLANAFDPYRPWALPRGLESASPLSTAASVFAQSLAEDGVSPNTVSAFDADLRLFAEAIGADTPIADIDTTHVDRFRRFLVQDRGAACSPASLRRRLTAVQSLFRYLVSEGLVESNPVSSLSSDTSTSAAKEPSGDLLAEPEAEALMQAAREEAADNDWRPLLLVGLLLHTGISKAECLTLRVADLDRDAGTLSVGGGDRRRSLAVDPEIVDAYCHYIEGRPDDGSLFDCTGRNLEYVLARLGRAAGLPRNPSFRVLRATAAARLQAGGAGNAAVAEHLGISRHTWPALRRRIRRASSR